MLDDDPRQVKRTRELNEIYVREFQIRALWRDYGIVGNIVVRIFVLCTARRYLTSLTSVVIYRVFPLCRHI